MKQINIGLFGYGVVGSGFANLVAATGGASIRKIAVKHPFLHPELGAGILAADRYDILRDPEINLVVEAIDDPDAAFEILKLALEQGKPVITANKQMVAAHLPEIIRLQKRFHTPVLYEAACCAAIPVIRTLEDYFRPELLQRLSGIINGSTNYILTAMERYRFRFDHALQLAQEAGFAESDAALDVEGKDAASKLSIILRHLWGTYIPPSQLIYTGIQHILPQDLRLGEQLNAVVKLVAQTIVTAPGKVAAFILPKLALKGSMLYQVLHEYNGLVLSDGEGNEHFLYGKGSGGAPTAQGLWADVQALQRGYAYTYPAKDAYKSSYDYEITVHLSVPEYAALPEAVLPKLQYYSSDSRYQYYVGKLGLELLAEGDWWKCQGISLIDISDIEAEDEAELKEKLESVKALQTDIFQQV
jgi:homoserine dehydrogenase